MQQFKTGLSNSRVKRICKQGRRGGEGLVTFDTVDEVRIGIMTYSFYMQSFRLENNQTRAYTFKSPMGSRKRRKPPTRRIDDVENDKTLNIKNLQRVAAYRWNWRKRAMDVAKTCNRFVALRVGFGSFFKPLLAIPLFSTTRDIYYTSDMQVGWYDLTNTVQPMTMKIGMYMYLLKRRVLCYLLCSAPHQVVVQHINFCTDQSFAKLPT
ncbi:hypothetical protein TNCV_565291 [Trichonephila clavipes]|nr:hypothetical protein TNCV_565291 [Trichonephila clavipes]